MSAANETKRNLFDMSQDEIGALLAELGQPAYRARQIVEWLYKHKAVSFDEMSSLPKALRDKLAAETRIGVLEQVDEQHSSDG